MTLPRDQIGSYLHVLAGDHPHGRFIEIRAIDRARALPVVRAFVPAHDPATAAALIEKHARLCDVYVGVALRMGTRNGGKTAIVGSHLAHIECDTAAAHEALAAFACPPTIMIASGTPGHRHAYWQLDGNVGNDDVEELNRRLADHLGGDMASVDIARVLRPPGTINHKHHPKRAVHLLAYRPQARYSPSAVAAVLPDPPPLVRRQSRATRRLLAHDQIDASLRAIPADRYALSLTGAAADRAGKIACPFHDDDTPSLQLYDSTFYCFGCRRGGSIYDFAAALWGIPTRGSGFHELRHHLAEIFGGTNVGPQHPPRSAASPKASACRGRPRPRRAISAATLGVSRTFSVRIYLVIGVKMITQSPVMSREQARECHSRQHRAGDNRNQRQRAARHKNAEHAGQGHADQKRHFDEFQYFHTR